LTGERQADRVRIDGAAHGDKSMTIELKPEHQRIVENAVQSGHYRSVDEFLDEAFAAWKTRDNQPKFDRKRARAAADRIRELRKGVSLRGLTIKDLVNEGRR
jgi:Arc/MetJ-type ribon-helix-helix transcriptional regulator